MKLGTALFIAKDKSKKNYGIYKWTNVANCRKPSFMLCFPRITLFLVE